MGCTPNKFVEDYFEPSLGDTLVMGYGRDLGLSSEKAVSTGRVVEVFTDDEDNFTGFKMSVEESEHLKPDQDPKLQFSASKPNHDMDVYVVWPSRSHKINAIPGAVQLEEVESFD